MNKKLLLVKQFFLLLILIYSFNLRAQDVTSTPVAYLEYIGNVNKAIVKDFLSYESSVAHDKNSKKTEAKRSALLKTSQDAIKKVSALPDYKGDKSLRDSSKMVLEISYLVLSEDYGKIVNLEEIAEQSYDAMEAFMLAQEMASEKLSKAHERFTVVEKDFAKKNNITLIELKDDLSKKLELLKKVNNYHKAVYLIFFKSYKQENYLSEAVEKNDINSIEQNKNALINTTEDGLKKLNSISSFDNDAALKQSTKELLDFYSIEAKDKINDVTSYLIKKEKYEKEKKAFEAMRESERTKQIVKDVNKSVEEYNKSVAVYNKSIKYLNENRAKLIDKWNKTSEKFFADYTPRYN